MNASAASPKRSAFNRAMGTPPKIHNHLLTIILKALPKQKRHYLCWKGSAVTHWWLRAPSGAMMKSNVLRLNAARLCNESVEGFSQPADRESLKAAAAQKIEELFDVLKIDYRNDHNTRETPQRVAKMLVEEILSGRFTDPPKITDFENVQSYDELIVTGPIEVRSTCAHHMMPIYGSAYIGVLPATDGKIIGLSKYDRIVDYFSSRLQIQEELVKQIEKFIVDTTQPRGLAVRISAVHMCKTHRGVRASHQSRMVNSTFYGEMSRNPALRAEFLQECAVLESR